MRVAFSRKRDALAFYFNTFKANRRDDLLRQMSLSQYLILRRRAGFFWFDCEKRQEVISTIYRALMVKYFVESEQVICPGGQKVHESIGFG